MSRFVNPNFYFIFYQSLVTSNVIVVVHVDGTGTVLTTLRLIKGEGNTEVEVLLC